MRIKRLILALSLLLVGCTKTTNNTDTVVATDVDKEVEQIDEAEETPETIALGKWQFSDHQVIEFCEDGKGSIYDTMYTPYDETYQNFEYDLIQYSYENGMLTIEEPEESWFRSKKLVESCIKMGETYRVTGDGEHLKLYKDDELVAEMSNTHDTSIVEKIVGKWIVNEHQTLVIDDHNGGTLSDDGTGRLDGVADDYEIYYTISQYNHITFTMPMLETETVESMMSQYVYREGDNLYLIPLYDHSRAIVLKKTE